VPDPTQRCEYGDVHDRPPERLPKSIGLTYPVKAPSEKKIFMGVSKLGEAVNQGNTPGNAGEAVSSSLSTYISKKNVRKKRKEKITRTQREVGRKRKLCFQNPGEKPSLGQGRQKDGWPKNTSHSVPLELPPCEEEKNYQIQKVGEERAGLVDG